MTVMMKVREEEKKGFCVSLFLKSETSLLPGTQSEGGLGAKSQTGSNQGSALQAGGFWR